MPVATLAKPAAAEPQDIRVSIIDDAVVVRGLVSRWIEDEDGLRLVSSYRNGKMAVEKIAADRPHVIVLDVEMPEMDGLTALPLLLKACPGARVVMSSTVTRRNAEISLKALSLGAADYITKPESDNGVSGSADFRRQLVAKVRALGARALARAAGTTARPTTAAPAIASAPESGDTAFKLRAPSGVAPAVLAFGSSTGGPMALSAVLGNIDKSLFARWPVVITQHMPPTFTAMLAKHLTQATGIPAAEAGDGETVAPGRILVAPGGRHMVIEGTRSAPLIRLTDDPPVHFCRPAVDPLFRSLACVFGPTVLACVLTGMGSDGADGAEAIAAAGGTVLAQDEASSVVWGMPKAAVQRGVCSAVLSISDLPNNINKLGGVRVS